MHIELNLLRIHVHCTVEVILIRIHMYTVDCRGDSYKNTYTVEEILIRIHIYTVEVILIRMHIL